MTDALTHEMLDRLELAADAATVDLRRIHDLELLVLEVAASTPAYVKTDPDVQRVKSRLDRRLNQLRDDEGIEYEASLVGMVRVMIDLGRQALDEERRNAIN